MKMSRIRLSETSYRNKVTGDEPIETMLARRRGWGGVSNCMHRGHDSWRLCERLSCWRPSCGGSLRPEHCVTVELVEKPEQLSRREKLELLRDCEGRQVQMKPNRFRPEIALLSSIESCSRPGRVVEVPDTQHIARSAV
ncbi:hypothetical protein MRB53_038811 [Persea americana]|nr:hypothetical protein MRB53_038811 [Persea americana]